MVLGAAVVGSNISQVAWLIGGARVLPEGRFGTVLAAQAMYGILQMITDNGSSFLGARLSARGELTDGQRRELVRARSIIGLYCAGLGLAVATIGGTTFVAAFAPFAVALVLLPMLNVWEPYGRGSVVPLALYLLLRSLILGVLVGVLALASTNAPVEVAGLCELATILAVGLVCGAWSSPRGAGGVRSATWRSIRDIGTPAVLTQYNFAVGTVVLGVCGQTAAAATCGVAFRLLTGTQGINGVVGTAIFPRLAQRQGVEVRRNQPSRLVAAGTVLLGGAALVAVAVAAPALVSGLLNTNGRLEEAALIAAMGTAGAAGLLMHQSFVLVAGGAETQLRRAAVAGTVMVTASAAVAAATGGQAAVFIVLGGFALGQSATLLMAGREPLLAGRDNVVLSVVAIGLLPMIAATLALSQQARVPLGGVVGVGALLCVVALSRSRDRAKRVPSPR